MSEEHAEDVECTEEQLRAALKRVAKEARQEAFAHGRPVFFVKNGSLIALHPEYHPILEAPDRNLDRDWRPEGGEVNPFLHLALHLAVAEQLAIDRPAGIRAEFDRIRAARGDEHAALHAVLECLGEVVWTAQRHGNAPDAQLYLTCLQRQR